MASVPVTTGGTCITRATVPSGQVAEVRFPPRLRLPRHDHGKPTVAVILAGGFEGQLAGRSTECRASTIRVEPAGEPHTNLFGPMGARILLLQPEPLTAGLPGPVRRWLGAPKDASEVAIVAMAWSLAAELARNDDLTPLAVEGLVLSLLAAGARLPVPGEYERPRWLGRVEELLRDRFPERLTLDEVSREAGVHALRLARVFRAHHQVSVATYVRRLRVDYAMRRLATSDEPIAAIAAEAGFSDQSHLNRQFRRFTGLTPARYRSLVRPAGDRDTISRSGAEPRVPGP